MHYHQVHRFKLLSYLLFGTARQDVAFFCWQFRLKSRFQCFDETLDRRERLKFGLIQADFRFVQNSSTTDYRLSSSFFLSFFTPKSKFLFSRLRNHVSNLFKLTTIVFVLSRNWAWPLDLLCFLLISSPRDANYHYFVTQFYLGCRIHQTNLATPRADPIPVLPCLARIPNHWLKGGVWVKNPTRLFRPLLPNPLGWSTSDVFLTTR